MEKLNKKTMRAIHATEMGRVHAFTNAESFFYSLSKPSIWERIVKAWRVLRGAENGTTTNDSITKIWDTPEEDIAWKDL